jgi:hypothetical protein
MTKMITRSSALQCLGFALTLWCWPIKAYALPECSEWIDEVRGVESLAPPLSISVEYHDLYCAQYGTVPGHSSLEDAEAVRDNRTYLVLYRSDTGAEIATYGYLVDDSDSQYFDEVSIPKAPVGFPYVGILYARYGGSSHYREYHIYSTEPALKQIAVIKQPVDGDDWPEIEGFYEEDGQFLIDTSTTKGTPVGSCNACQKWNIETFALADGELDSVYLGQRDDQDFDLEQWLYTVGYKLMN